MNILFSLGAIVIGVLIGMGFGTIQNNAFRRNEKLQRSGKLNNSWSVMPGSMRRIFYLVVLLMGIQILCPVLFSDSTTQWLISAGIVVGYGWILSQRIRLHREIHS